jgi:hypothetical protein
MSTASGSPPLGAAHADFSKDPEKFGADTEIRDNSIEYGKAEDILGQQDIDPALNAKMHIVNNVRYYNPELLYRVGCSLLMRGTVLIQYFQIGY